MKFIQIVPYGGTLAALADDGTVWYYRPFNERGCGDWVRLAVPTVPQ